MSRRHRERLIAQTTLGVGATVFLFGFLVGRLTEPVPGMFEGVAWLWWLAPPLVAAVAVARLVTMYRTVRRQMRQARVDDRSREFSRNKAATIRRLSALVDSTATSRE